jgi:cytochrome P450
MNEPVAKSESGGPAPECPNGFHPLRWEDAADPFDKLKELRARCPVSTVRFDPLPPMKLFTRFEDISAIYRDWQTFGNMATIVNVEEHNATPPDDRQIIATDPPRHGALRRFALLALAPDRIDKFVPSIASYAAERSAQLPRGQEFDLMTHWAAPIPSVATARVIGLPDQDALDFRRWVRMGVEGLARTMSPSSPAFQWKSGASAYGGGSLFPESADFVGKWVRARRADPNPPTDDLLARMLSFVDPETGTRFGDEQMVAQLVTIIAAGNDTTAGLVGNLVYRMLTVPGLWDRLRTDRSRIALAIEESLRIDPPQQMFPRLCMKDTVVGGVAVKQGEVIIVSMASANRDEEIYGSDADEFKFDRKYPTPRHLAMGRGIHTCIGAYLARKVTNVSINALLDAVPAMKLAPGYKYEKVLFHHFRAPERLPVII